MVRRCDPSHKNVARFVLLATPVMVASVVVPILTTTSCFVPPQMNFTYDFAPTGVFGSTVKVVSAASASLPISRIVSVAAIVALALLEAIVKDYLSTNGNCALTLSGPTFVDGISNEPL